MHVKGTYAGGVVAALAIGVGGSALWELLKPVLGWLWQAMIAIATLGLDGVRDSMYARTAGMTVDGAAAMASDHFTASVALLMFSFAAGAYPSASRRIFGRQMDRRLRLVFIAYSFIGVAFAFGMVIASTRDVYARGLVKHRAHVIALVRPHVDQKQLDALEAEYWQVNGRGAFLNHMKTLTALAQQKGVQTPTRSFF